MIYPFYNIQLWSQVDAHLSMDLHHVYIMKSVAVDIHSIQAMKRSGVMYNCFSAVYLAGSNIPIIMHITWWTDGPWLEFRSQSATLSGQAWKTAMKNHEIYFHFFNRATWVGYQMYRNVQPFLSVLLQPQQIKLFGARHVNKHCRNSCLHWRVPCYVVICSREPSTQKVTEFNKKIFGVSRSVQCKTVTNRGHICNFTVSMKTQIKLTTHGVIYYNARCKHFLLCLQPWN